MKLMRLEIPSSEDGMHVNQFSISQTYISLFMVLSFREKYCPKYLSVNKYCTLFLREWYKSSKEEPYTFIVKNFNFNEDSIFVIERNIYEVV